MSWTIILAVYLLIYEPIFCRILNFTLDNQAIGMNDSCLFFGPTESNDYLSVDLVSGPCGVDIGVAQSRECPAKHCVDYGLCGWTDGQLERQYRFEMPIEGILGRYVEEGPGPGSWIILSASCQTQVSGVITLEQMVFFEEFEFHDTPLPGGQCLFYGPVIKEFSELHVELDTEANQPIEFCYQHGRKDCPPKFYPEVCLRHLPINANAFVPKGTTFTLYNSNMTSNVTVSGKIYFHSWSIASTVGIVCAVLLLLIIGGFIARYFRKKAKAKRSSDGQQILKEMGTLHSGDP